MTFIWIVIWTFAFFLILFFVAFFWLMFAIFIQDKISDGLTSREAWKKMGRHLINMLKIRHNLRSEKIKKGNFNIAVENYPNFHYHLVHSSKSLNQLIGLCELSNISITSEPLDIWGNLNCDHVFCEECSRRAKKFLKLID